MKSTSILAACALALASSHAFAGTLLSESFDSVSSLAGKGWFQTNLSAPVGVSNWFQGNDTVFAANVGAPTSYVAANFLNGVEGLGNSISNWLMMPTLPLASGVTLSFDLRLLGEGFLDTVEVWVSTSGNSTNVADFSQIATYSSSTDTGWVSQSLTLSGINGITDGRLAFRYVASDTSTQANYVGIDSALVVPEPTSLALVGLALLGATAVSRRKTV
jgi:PEP-CTERM motif